MKMQPIRQSGSPVASRSYAATFLILGSSAGDPNWHQPTQTPSL